MDRDIVIEESWEDFPKQTMPEKMDITIIRSVSPGQLVSLKAKVAHLYPPKQVTIKTELLNLQECSIVDANGTIKFVLWGDYVGSVKQGETYYFQDVRVKYNKYENEIFINTAKSTSKISEAPPFEEVLSVAIEISNTTAKGEVLGVLKVGDYLSCSKCNKKVQLCGDSPIVNCTACHYQQKQKVCKKN